MSPSTTFTGNCDWRILELIRCWPSCTSNCQPCQGHVTTQPDSTPFPKGPPWCGQTPSRAKYSPSTQKRATTRPDATFSTHAPAGHSSVAAIWIHLLTANQSKLSSRSGSSPSWRAALPPSMKPPILFGAFSYDIF